MIQHNMMQNNHEIRDTRPEFYISVDVETAGPNPGQYSLLAIGACTIHEPRATFYIELQPVNQANVPTAMAIHRLDLEQLAQNGIPPADAMAQFEAWLQQVTPPGSRPVFVAFNAPFDWMFVADYFHRTLGRNPFGHSALDIKALYMGLQGVPWSETAMRHVARRYQCSGELIHHALDDALNQARLFECILAAAGLA